MSISLKKWTAPSKGALFVVTGPSGTGKTTLVRHALEHTPHISFSVSATTRSPRDTEKDGIDYHFWDTQTFRKKVEDKESSCLTWLARL